MQRLLFRKVPKQSVDRSNVVVVAIGTSVCTKLKQTQIRCSENTIPHTKSGCGNRPASVKVQIDKKTRKPPSSTPPLPNATPMSLGPTQSLRVRSHSQNAMTNTRHQLEKEGKKKKLPLNQDHPIRRIKSWYTVVQTLNKSITHIHPKRNNDENPFWDIYLGQRFSTKMTVIMTPNTNSMNLIKNHKPMMVTEKFGTQRN